MISGRWRTLEVDGVRAFGVIFIQEDGTRTCLLWLFLFALYAAPPCGIK